MDFETFDFELLGDDAMSWKIQKVEDHTPVAIANAKQKASGNNGWCPGRGIRRFARIPPGVIEVAERQGYDMASEYGVRTFFADNKEMAELYLTVPYIKSPDNGSAVSSGHVIIH